MLKPARRPSCTHCDRCLGWAVALRLADLAYGSCPLYRRDTAPITRVDLGSRIDEPRYHQLRKEQLFADKLADGRLPAMDSEGVAIDAVLRRVCVINGKKRDS